MSTNKLPHLGLVGEIGYSQDILNMLEEQESDLSDIETESQDVLERSNMDEIFDNYVPVSDYDDRGISFEQVDLTENPQEVPVRDNTHQAIPLSQTSIMSYIFPNGSVEQESPTHVHRQAKKDSHVIITGRSRNSQGRPKDLIREDFTVTRGGKKVMCPDCSLEISNRVDVMKNHRNTCKIRKRNQSSATSQVPSQSERDNIPVTIRETASVPEAASVPGLQAALVTASEHEEISESDFSQASLTSERSSLFSQASEPATASEPLDPNITLKRKQQNYENWEEAPPSKKKLKQFFDKVSPKESHEIDLQLGKMIFGCNLPFAIVENPEFKDLMKILRPAYKPPNRKLVGTEILDGVYSEVKKCLTNEIADKEVTLVQDGWSTSQTQPVIAHSIHSGSNAYFFNAIAPSTATKDSEYCLSLLISAIDDCEKNHSCKVIGVVTDNCKVMLSLRAKLNNQRSDIFVYGCNAHYLNLVGQKLIPSDKIDSIVKIQKYFKNHHFQSAALTVANGKRPVVPGLTRWNSQIDCLENYIENHAIYLDILRRNPRKFDKDITKLINDFSLYTDAEQLKNAAKPISVALDKVQSNSSTLSEAVFEWIQLRNANLFKDDLALKYFQKKLDEAFSETALSAYILDPRYRGLGLLSEEKHRAYDWMDGLNDDLALLAMDLEAKNDQKFPSFLMRDDRLSKIDPRTFWNALKGNSTIDATACEIAQRLQKLPASGSSIERCFSTLNSIMTKTRNRLGIEKAGKLCTIYQSLRFMREDDW